MKRRVGVAVLWFLLLTSAAILIHNVYRQGLDFTLFGLRMRSTGWFRPALVAFSSWLGLGRLRPRLRPNRDLVVILVCLVAYFLTFHGAYSMDVTPSEYTALSVATGRGTSLDDYPELVEHGVPYFIYTSPQGLRSHYPLGPALLAWAVFVPAPLSNLPRPELTARLGIVSAILIGLASVALALQIIKRLAPPFSPHLLAIAYGLGTTHWSTSSSALWQHGPGELWVLGAIERLTDQETPPRRRLLALGFCLAMAVITRPSLALSATLILALTFYYYGRRTVHSVVAAIGTAIPLLTYHLEIYGSVLGPYISQSHGLALRPLGEWLEAAFWLMASPSRGVLWYEPVVGLTLAVAFVHAVRRRGGVLLWTGLLGFSLTLALYGSWFLWWGGYSFGPRLMTDALPWWLVAVASMGAARPWFRRATLGLTAAGALVSVIGAVSNPVMWDDRPSVDFFPERLQSLGDSQLVTGALATLAGENLTRRAVFADTHGQYETALALWSEEWRAHRWHAFAAGRVADLLLRTDRLREAEAHVRVMLDRWPSSMYVRHLAQRLPAIIELLDEPSWIPPLAARASPNAASAGNVRDSSLITRWTTERPQKAGDWLELETDPALTLRGVAVFFAPEFGEGPGTLRAVGKTPEGDEIRLGELDEILAERKGWVVLRFSPTHLASLRLSLLEARAPPWSVTEARLLVAGPNPPRLVPERPAARTSSSSSRE